MGAAHNYEEEVVAKLPLARQMVDAATVRVEELSRRLRELRPPVVTVLGGSQ